jgi:beta-lactamase regulating signal transducer with metallopeptidase domain
MTALLQALLALLLQSTALLLLGLLALRLTRKHGPALQTLIGRASLAAVALLLLLAPLTGHVPSVVRIGLPEPTLVRSSPTLPRGEGTELHANVGTPFVAPSVSATASDSAPSTPAIDATYPQEHPNNSQAYSSPLTPPSRFGRVGACAGVGSWLAVSLALLLWLGVCQWHLTRLRRTARPITSGPAVALLAELTPNPPPLLTHLSVHSPFLAGLRCPAIFLPVTYETEFDPAALRAILAHELAHRDRRDNLWTLAARLLTAALWPQVLLWLLVRRLEQISEDACDEAVLAQNCPPRAYADCLLTLAERWQPSRREHALSAGVAPFRSSVGRRVAQLLSVTRRPSAAPTRHLRIAIAACTLLAACGSVLLLNVAANNVTANNVAANVDLPHFLWAKQQAWAVRPVRVIDLDHPGLTRIASLPYDITEQDKATIAQIRHLSEDYKQPMTQKQRLKAILAAQPHFFYAEYLLGSWYRQHGDSARATALQMQALRDAPVVLAGRYEYDDGTPLAGLRMSTTILCFSPAHLKAKGDRAFQNIAVRLDYEDVVTDADGCYYIPAFKAIYSQQGMGWNPDQLNTLTASRLKAHADLITPGPATSGTTSNGDEEHLDTGFIAESRVAVLPQTQVRRKIVLSASFNAANGSIEKPLSITGSGLTISWQPYPKAVQYRVQVDEHHPHYGKHGIVDSDGWSQIIASSSNPSRLGLPITQTSVKLNFAGNDPSFNRTLPYTFLVVALDRNGEKVSESDQFAFKPLNALAPEPLTKAALAQALGPGFVVKSIQSQKDQIIATVLTPPNAEWTLAMTQAIQNSGRQFGLGSYAGSSSPAMSMSTANPARIMQIIYQKKGD